MGEQELSKGGARHEHVGALQDRLHDAYATDAVAATPASNVDLGTWIRRYRLEQAAAADATADRRNEAVRNEAVPRTGLVAERSSDDDAGALGKTPGSGFDPAAAPKLPPAVYLSSLFINILALALPLVVLQVYDRILPNEATETLTVLAIGLVGVLALDAAMKLARAYMIGRVTARHHFEVATEAITRLLHAPSSMLEREAPTVHVDRVNALDTLRDFYGGQSLLLLLDLPFIALFFGLIAFIGGYLVLVPIVAFILLGGFAVVRAVALRDVLLLRAENGDRRYDFIAESLTGIETVKLMAMEPQLLRRFERLQKIGADASYRTILLGNAAQITGNLLSSLTMIGVVSVGAYLVISGSATIGTLAACTLLSGRAVQPLLRGLGLWTQIQTISVARQRVEQLFEFPGASSETAAGSDTGTGALSIRNVSFAYGKDQPLVIDNVTLDVAPGEIIGLRGGDGSGKSTLIRLIVGDIAPRSGEVRIDGENVCSAGRSAIMQRIAFVPQVPSFFRGTILENISMFRTGPAIDDARAAARLIGLEADIERLPNGYDTPIGDGITDELPAGFLQRIVIARALARKPKILLFDEGNATLDARSDMLWCQGLQRLRGKMTVILVSQRPSLLRQSDRIFGLRDGKLLAVSVERETVPQGAATPGGTQVAS